MLTGRSLLKFNVLLESWKPANTKITIQPDPTSATYSPATLLVEAIWHVTEGSPVVTSPGLYNDWHYHLKWAHVYAGCRGAACLPNANIFSPAFVSHTQQTASVILVMQLYILSAFLIVAHLAYVHTVSQHAGGCFYVCWIDPPYWCEYVRLVQMALSGFRLRFDFCKRLLLLTTATTVVGQLPPTEFQNSGTITTLRYLVVMFCWTFQYLAIVTTCYLSVISL